MIAKGVGHMNIAILGVGGVGGYFGAKICRAKEALQADVYFVARGAHLKAIQDNGLTVRTSSEGIIHCHPTLATSNIDELPSLDACLICVKSYDLNELTKRLTSKVSDGTEIVPLLNGIDIYDRIRANIHTGNVYPACVFIGTHIDEPGVISQDGGACKILFGKARAGNDHRYSHHGTCIRCKFHKQRMARGYFSLVVVKIHLYRIF